MQARINGIMMNYAVSGRETAPPVVLHHPLATNLSIWDELTAALESPTGVQESCCQVFKLTSPLEGNSSPG